MKKQNRKLTINKKTISNLNTLEMNQKVGGSRYYTCVKCYTEWGACDTLYCVPTQKGHTCKGNNC